MQSCSVIIIDWIFSSLREENKVMKIALLYSLLRRSEPTALFPVFQSGNINPNLMNFSWNIWACDYVYSALDLMRPIHCFREQLFTPWLAHNRLELKIWSIIRWFPKILRLHLALLWLFHATLIISVCANECFGYIYPNCVGYFYATMIWNSLIPGKNQQNYSFATITAVLCFTRTSFHCNWHNSFFAREARMQTLCLWRTPQNQILASWEKPIKPSLLASNECQSTTSYLTNGTTNA